MSFSKKKVFEKNEFFEKKSFLKKMSFSKKTVLRKKQIKCFFGKIYFKIYLPEYVACLTLLPVLVCCPSSLSYFRQTHASLHTVGRDWPKLESNQRACRSSQGARDRLHTPDALQRSLDNNQCQHAELLPKSRTIAKILLQVTRYVYLYQKW